jgi:creatinine amidohydrolase
MLFPQPRPARSPATRAARSEYHAPSIQQKENIAMLRIRPYAFVMVFAGSAVFAQDSLPVKWEELTAPDFVKAIDKAQQTCILPMGVVEKHGPHLPLGTDVFNARYRSVQAAQKEYAVVFPEYYFGQIFEATHEPGTIAYSARLLLDLLQETTNEMSRNGCKKIIIVNGHGGNPDMLRFFAQSQLASRRDYVVYVNFGPPAVKGGPARKTSFDLHAGEGETSNVLVSRPDLVHLDRAHDEKGVDLGRLKPQENAFTAIWWYARFPDHYAGDGAPANKELGDFQMQAAIAGIVDLIRAVKADKAAPQLQNEFYEKQSHPLDTKQ